MIQRGNNRQVCFANEQDFAAYAGWLKDCSKKYQVDIHAWVLMTNHVHLLCTPRADNDCQSHDAITGQALCAIFQFQLQADWDALGRPI